MKLNDCLLCFHHHVGIYYSKSNLMRVNYSDKAKFLKHFYINSNQLIKIKKIKCFEIIFDTQFYWRPQKSGKTSF